MKKFKKNISKTIFASFFVFQFVVSTSVMPLIANAEDVATASEESSPKEEKSPEVVKEETEVVEEESAVEEKEEGAETDTATSEDAEVKEVVEESTTEETSIDESGAEEKPLSEVSKEPKGEKPTKPDGKNASATVRVCKVILDENGNQVEGSEFPGAAFSLTLGIQDSSKTVTLATDDYADKRFVYEGGNAFHAMCDETELAFDPSLAGPTVYAKYFEEETSGDYLWEEKYNDGDVSGDAGFEDKFWLYMDEGGLNDRADGKLVLTGNTTTGFKGTILLVNKFDKYVDPTATSKGSISVCKIIAKRVNGNVVLASASEVPGYTFTVPWIGEPTTPGTEGFNTQPVISPDATFATNIFAPNKTILSGSNTNDAMCQTFSNLTLGSYYYGEEVISGGDGSVTWTTKYSDQILVPVNDLGDVDLYRNNIFTVGLDLGLDPRGSIDANGNSFNTNADGHIVLNRSNAGRNRTIVVVNIFEGKDTPPKFCESTRNLITNGSFETPEVSSAGWDIYNNGTSGLAWTAAWNGINPNVAPKTEIQENVSGWNAHSGDQYAELDSDQNGHVGTLNGEPASTKISQVINTVPGQFYKVTYEFGARPGTPESDNRLGFYVNGELYDDVSASGIGQTEISWGTRIFAFTATGTQTTISFADLGNPNSFGTFLDSVEVVCVDDEDPRNTPPKILVNPLTVCLPLSATTYNFLSGVLAEDAEDGDITSLVQITSNNVDFGTEGAYTVVYSVTDSNGATTTASRTIFVKENCGGGGDNKYPTITFNPHACIVVGTPNFDFMSGVVVTDDEGVNQVIVKNNGSTAVDFSQAGSYTVTYTAKDSDGNETIRTRTITISANCGGGGGGDDHPTITLPEGQCYEVGTTNFNFLTGVIALDSEGNAFALDLTLHVFGEENIDFTQVGQDPDLVTYTFTDPFTGEVVDAERSFFISEDCDNGGGGGDDEDPTITLPDNACIELNNDATFDYLNGVSALDFTGATITLVVGDNLTIVGTVNLAEEGEYTITYTVTDPFLNTATASRTITVDNDCDNGGGGGGGGGGGSSSSGGSRGGNRGEVLGATSCVAFTTYNKLGNTGGEIKALQTFLNEYMDAGLTVDGVYGRSTAQAVHDFQAFHWSEVIDPWTPPLSPNTTGWQYKTTRMTINAIIDCPEPAVYLEDPGVMYEVKEVKDMKSFSLEQKEVIYNLLAEAQSGQVLGATDANVVTPDIFNPNYDLLFGK